MLSSRRLFLISGLAGSLAAQATCTEGPCDQLDDENVLLQIGRDGPPPCSPPTKCGEQCQNRQGKWGICNLILQCEIDLQLPDCSGGGVFQHDVGNVKPLYCAEPQNQTCYPRSKGYPSCCLDTSTTPCPKEKQACDKITKFYMPSNGRCVFPAKFIDNKAECVAAAKSLGIGVTLRDASKTTSPYGCYYREDRKTLWFNPNGDRSNVDPIRRSICESESECSSLTCGVKCSQGVCSSSGTCLKVANPKDLGCDRDANYVLVSITEYNIDSSYTTDSWWQGSAADAFVEVKCADSHFVSDSYPDQNTGDVKLHFFAPRGESCDVYLHDKDADGHETILKQAMSMNPGSGRFKITRQSCFGWSCSTITVASLKYRVVDGVQAQIDISNLDGKLTAGQPTE